MNLEIVLTPLQQEAAAGLLESLAVSPVVVLQGAAGTGKSMIFQVLFGLHGGALLGAQHIPGIRQAHGPAAIEEAFFRMIEDALQEFDLVFVDDLTLVTNAARGGGHGRVHLLDVALTAILEPSGPRPAGDPGLIGAQSRSTLRCARGVPRVAARQSDGPGAVRSFVYLR